MLTDKAILVVGRASDTHAPLIEALRTLGPAVAVAADAADAARKLRHLRFDLVVLDGTGAGSNALEAIASIRLADPQCGMIVVGSKPDDTYHAVCRQLGIRRLINGSWHLGEPRNLLPKKQASWKIPFALCIKG
ncbi:MAG: response regulator [Planctomycetota bacterium]|jgi:CheY-like chemotaxis protein